MARWPLDTQLPVLESRVFDKNLGPSYPEFSTIESWLAWRLQLAFPDRRLRAADGWTPEYFEWATARAREHFV